MARPLGLSFENDVCHITAYIHLNPLRAGVVKHLEEYQWSSFLDYIGAREPVIERLDVSFILNQFGNNLAQAQERYKEFVMDNMGMENPLKDAFKGIAVGTEAFIEKVKEKIPKTHALIAKRDRRLV